MGIAFPMAEVISTYIPPSFYEGFYLYLYFGSMLFLLYMYAMLLKDKAAASVSNSFSKSSKSSSFLVGSIFLAVPCSAVPRRRLVCSLQRCAVPDIGSGYQQQTE